MTALTARQLYEFGTPPMCPWNKLPESAKSRWRQIAKDRAAKLGQSPPVESP